MVGARTFLGVHFDKRTRRYAAAFRGAFLGRYQNAEDAAIARDRAALEASSDLPLNFRRRALRLGPASPAELQEEALAHHRRRMGRPYYGVRPNPDGTYEAHVSIERRDVFLGRFERSRDAAIAHDRVQRFVNPAKGWLNFPHVKVDPISTEGLRKELRTAFKKRTSSRYDGVNYEPRDLKRPWAASVDVKRKKVFLGRWTSERDAAVAHDRGVLHYRGKHAPLNITGSAKLVPADAETLVAEARREKKDTTASRFLGVSFHKRAKKWSASYWHGARTHHIGLFENEEEAALAYDKTVVALRGASARVNLHPVTGEPVGGRRLRDLGPASPSPKASRKAPVLSSDRSSRATTTRRRTRPRGRRA